MPGLTRIHRGLSLLLSGLLAPVSLWLCAACALAQGYPVKSVRIVVPVPAGGYYDNVARVVGQKLTEKMGQPFVIENRVGAGGLVGTAYVATTAPDGYTLLVNGTGGMSIFQSIHPKPPYDTLRDFAPISLLSGVPQIVVVNASVPANNMAELLSLLRARPGEMAFATTGNGTVPHLSTEAFSIATKVKMLHVPYNGSAPAVTSLLGGQTSMAFGIATDVFQHVRAGKMRALAVTTEKRMPVLPDVPTLAEAGIAGMVIEIWGGLFAPKGTPADIVNRLSAEANQIVQTAEARDKIAPGGIGDTKGSTPEQFERFLRAEIAMWARVVKESGAKID